jgi:hypothetical protein
MPTAGETGLNTSLGGKGFGQYSQEERKRSYLQDIASTLRKSGVNVQTRDVHSRHSMPDDHSSKGHRLGRITFQRSTGSPILVDKVQTTSCSLAPTLTATPDTRAYAYHGHFPRKQGGCRIRPRLSFPITYPPPFWGLGSVLRRGVRYTAQDDSGRCRRPRGGGRRRRPGAAGTACAQGAAGAQAQGAGSAAGAGGPAGEVAAEAASAGAGSGGGCSHTQLCKDDCLR